MKTYLVIALAALSLYVPITQAQMYPNYTLMALKAGQRLRVYLGEKHPTIADALYDDYVSPRTKLRNEWYGEMKELLEADGGVLPNGCELLRSEIDRNGNFIISVQNEEGEVHSMKLSARGSDLSESSLIKKDVDPAPDGLVSYRYYDYLTNSHLRFYTDHNHNIYSVIILTNRDEETNEYEEKLACAANEEEWSKRNEDSLELETTTAAMVDRLEGSNHKKGPVGRVHDGKRDSSSKNVLAYVPKKATSKGKKQ